jgi:hypothetical protein
VGYYSRMVSDLGIPTFIYTYGPWCNWAGWDTRGGNVKFALIIFWVQIRQISFLKKLQH